MYHSDLEVVFNMPFYAGVCLILEGDLEMAHIAQRDINHSWTIQEDLDEELDSNRNACISI